MSGRRAASAIASARQEPCDSFTATFPSVSRRAAQTRIVDRQLHAHEPREREPVMSITSSAHEPRIVPAIKVKPFVEGRSLEPSSPGETLGF